MSKIIVLGAGMVGSAMAIDLAKKHQVTLTDVNTSTLQHVKNKYPQLNTFQLDVTQTATLKTTLQPFDLVICAVPVS